MTDPETLARRRWKQLAPVLENRDRVLGLHEEANARAAWLRERLPAAVHETRLAQARRSSPGAAADKRRAGPAAGGARDARGAGSRPRSRRRHHCPRPARLRRRQQDKWHQEQARTVAQAQRVVHEEGGRKNRETLAEEQALLAWVDEPLPDVYVGLAEANQLAAVAYRRREAQPLQALARSTQTLERRVRINELLTGGGRYG
jgi:hypothetical protein